MQVKKIVSLCALAFAGMAASHAQAALSNPVHDAALVEAVTNGRVVFVSGASATQKGFSGISTALMQPGTAFRLANTTASARDYEAIAGRLLVAAGGWPAGSAVVVSDRVGGGSVYGVDPVARPVGVGTSITKLDVTSATCGASGTGTSADPYVCTLNSGIPDAGISDVAPELFKSPINTEGEIAAGELSAAELNEFSAPGSKKAIYGLAFGVPVTNNVTVALNKSVVSAIMAGNLGTWDLVDSSLAAEDIVICRRTPGSGTQAVDNLYFGNYPCGNANTPAERISVGDGGAWDDATNTYTITPGSGIPAVIENFSSGDVRTCLDKAVTGGTYATKDRSGVAVTVNFTAPGNKAIGVLSMDSLSSSKTAGNWTFRSLGPVDGRLDCSGTCPATTAPTKVSADVNKGVYPTLDSYLDGSWDLQGWISFNIPKRTAANANKLALLNQFKNAAQSPTVLAGINDLKWVAGSIPGGSFSGAQVLKAEYLNGSQCAPLNRNYQ